jgi:hypothetical protein
LQIRRVRKVKLAGLHAAAVLCRVNGAHIALMVISSVLYVIVSLT